MPVCLCLLSLASNPATYLNPAALSKNGVDVQRVQGFWEPPLPYEVDPFLLPIAFKSFESLEHAHNDLLLLPVCLDTTASSDKTRIRKKENEIGANQEPSCTCAQADEMIG